MPGLRPTHVKKLSPCEQSEQGCGQYIYIIYTTDNVFSKKSSQGAIHVLHCSVQPRSRAKPLTQSSYGSYVKVLKFEAAFKLDYKILQRGMKFAAQISPLLNLKCLKLGMENVCVYMSETTWVQRLFMKKGMTLNQKTVIVIISKKELVQWMKYLIRVLCTLKQHEMKCQEDIIFSWPDKTYI